LAVRVFQLVPIVHHLYEKSHIEYPNMFLGIGIAESVYKRYC
jgi:hypothetical protein